MTRMRSVVVPELFLGLLSLAVAAVWIGHIFAGTIHEAKHTTDTISITASARKPIDSNLVQWSLNVDGNASTPVEAARRARRASTAVVAFLRGAGINADAISTCIYGRPFLSSSGVASFLIPRRHKRMCPGRVQNCRRTRSVRK